MITEYSKFNETYFTFTIENKKSVNIQNLVDKILKKQKEPFSKVFVILMPALFPAVFKYFTGKNLNIKNISTDKKHIFLEL
jgi:hypothetical protein